MALATRAVSKRGIRDRIAITLWGRRVQQPIIVSAPVTPDSPRTITNPRGTYV